MRYCKIRYVHYAIISIKSKYSISKFKIEYKSFDLPADFFHKVILKVFIKTNNK